MAKGFIFFDSHNVFYSFACEQTAFPIQSAGEAARVFYSQPKCDGTEPKPESDLRARAAHGTDGFGFANSFRNFT